MAIFKGQDLWYIELDTGRADLGSMDVTEIHYKKPSGVAGEWNATVNGTKLRYDIQAGDIDESGVWQFQTYIKSGNLDGWGTIVTEDIKKPLKED